MKRSIKLPIDASLREPNPARALLARWPLACPRNWLKLVNAPQTEAELQAVRTAVRRGSPLGSEAWQTRVVKRLGLESTLRPRGRPRITPVDYD